MQLKAKSGIYPQCGITVHAVKVKVRNITEMAIPAHAVNGKVRNIPDLWRSRKSSQEYT
jgi:hypothetical protein